ncbi:unnamed protein product [Anisakis simplex]|uniref:Uncharacterized protein n=1 Tax=Anisakis simplex TaxID=6269 RepID=A0A0M3KK83_ANISI|nr:unnamed protein product [Anisakis simplex]
MDWNRERKTSEQDDLCVKSASGQGNYFLEMSTF